MRKDKVRGHCPRCRHQQIFIRAEINHWLHFALAILTAGLWLVSWVALCIGKVLRPWRCEHCGWHKPEFLTRPGKRRHATDPGREGRPARGASHAIPAGPLLGAQTSNLRP